MRADSAESVAGELVRMLPLVQEKLIRPFEQLAKSSVSPMQFHVLLALNEKGALGMTQVARDLATSKQQMTPIVDKLMAAGYVRRMQDDGDRRVVKISLSPAGREFLEKQRQGIVEMLKEKIRPLGNANLLALRTAVREISRIVDTLP